MSDRQHTPPPAPETVTSPSDPSRPGDASPSHGSSDRESAAEKGTASEDVVLIHGRTDDGKGLKVLRKRDEELSIGEVRPMEEGKPLAGDLVRLRPRPQAPMLCDVDVEYEAPKQDASGKRDPGPARVSSAAYRKGWDRMWGKRTKTLGKPN